MFCVVALASAELFARTKVTVSCFCRSSLRIVSSIVKRSVELLYVRPKASTKLSIAPSGGQICGTVESTKWYVSFGSRLTEPSNVFSARIFRTLTCSGRVLSAFVTREMSEFCEAIAIVSFKCGRCTRSTVVYTRCVAKEHTGYDALVHQRSRVVGDRAIVGHEITQLRP
jgi:hypothetical protein